MLPCVSKICLTAVWWLEVGWLRLGEGLLELVVSSHPEGPVATPMEEMIMLRVLSSSPLILAQVRRMPQLPLRR